MEIQNIKIEELKFSDYNPRDLTDKEKEELKKSLTKFGFVEPIVVNQAENRKNIIVGGHQRIKVAKEMGITEVPVVFVNISDEQQEKELNIRLNKNLGHWDWEKLAAFDSDFLEKMGFEKWELEKFVVNVNETLPSMVGNKVDKKTQMTLMFSAEELEEVNKAIKSIKSKDNSSAIYQICQKFNNLATDQPATSGKTG